MYSNTSDHSTAWCAPCAPILTVITTLPRWRCICTQFNSVPIMFYRLYAALYGKLQGYNVAMGASSLYSNSDGSENAALGHSSFCTAMLPALPARHSAANAKGNTALVTTQLWDILLCLNTIGSLIQPLVAIPCIATLQVTPTQVLVQRRCTPTRPAARIQLPWSFGLMYSNLSVSKMPLWKQIHAAERGRK